MLHSIRHSGEPAASEDTAALEMTDKTMAIEQEKPYKLEEIVGDENIVGSVTDPSGNRAFVIADRSEPAEYEFFTETGPGVFLYSNEKLIFADLGKGERKDFELYDLASDPIIDFVEEISIQTQYSLNAGSLEWSEDGKVLWGAINLVSSADPPVISLASFFKIRTDDLSVTKYPLPEGVVNYSLNLEAEKVLVEAIEGDKLRLSVYDLPAEREEVVVSYENIGYEPYEYVYPEYFDKVSKSLESEWADNNSVHYIDFVTQQSVIREIQ